MIMKKTLALCSLGVAMALPVSAADYTFDKAHTNVQFGVSHNGLSNFLGQFQDFSGTFDINEEDLTQSSFEVVIQTASVDTDVPALDDHLKNADFFDVGKYPQMRFKSERIVQVTANKYAVEGQLTMLDKTLPVTLDAQLNFQGRHPLADFFPVYDTRYLGFSATASIRRTDFGMTTYAPMLGDQVNITLEAELKRKQ